MKQSKQKTSLQICTFFGKSKQQRRGGTAVQSMRSFTLVALLQIAAAFSLSAVAGTQSRQLEIVPRSANAPLIYDAPILNTAAGQEISVTRLDLLISNVSFQNSDGAWIQCTNTYGYIDGRNGRTAFDISSIPAGRYNRLRFLIGLTPEINRANPSTYPPSHALNPNVNGLHWSWMGGFVFLALEGYVFDRDGTPRGYSFHLATDRQLMTVDLPVALDLTENRALMLNLHVDRIFGGRHTIAIDDASASTHSRPNDILADQLRENIEQSFTVEAILDPHTSTPPIAAPKLEVAPDATPYRLTISRFFPRPALPLDNPLTEEGVELGRRLFFDPQLSRNNSQSCASCHQPEAGFVDKGKAVSVGADGMAGARNSMPLFNLAWRTSFFWDARAPSLREQVLQPIENPIEMHESLSNVIMKLTGSPGATSSAEKLPNYPELFARAFGSHQITADRIARALEQFLLTIVSHNSKFDRVLAGTAEFTGEEQRGFELFHTEYDPRREQFGADCFHCHGGPLFKSQSVGNNGLDIEPTDGGRFLATGKDSDLGKFVVPSLRNVALTAPYMHDGRLATLESVVEHYTTGVKRSATLDPNLDKHPDGGVPLSQADKRALVAFLKTLTEEPDPQTTNAAKREETALLRDHLPDGILDRSNER